MITYAQLITELSGYLILEYDAMSGDMALFFNGVADGSKFISIPHRDVKPIATRHKDFYLVMCGNTWGKGSIEYSGRDFQDMAFMDRFRFCKHFIGYHTIIEKAWTQQNYDFVMKLRAQLEKMGSYLSTRNIEDITRLINSGASKQDIIEMLIQDMAKSDKDSIKSELQNTTFYQQHG